MVGRILRAATLCLVAALPVSAADVPVEEPLVIGESAPGESVMLDPGLAEPGAVIIEEGVPTEPPRMEGGSDAGLSGTGCVSCGPQSTCVEAGSEWCGYTIVDALFMQRVNSAGPLAVESQGTADPGATVIAAGDVRFPTAPGVRVFQGWRRPDCTGIEIGYLGVWSMHADALAVSPTQDLALPGQLGLIDGSGFESASVIQPTVASTLNAFEVNVFETHLLDGCRRHDPLPWRRAWGILEGTTVTADWLVGIRWAGLDETANLDVSALTSSPPAALATTAYRVTTSSHLVGPQIGHRRRIDWGDWALEGWAKVGLMASQVSQAQSAVVGPFDGVQIREPRSSSRVGVGMIGDLNASVVRRLGDHWGLRAGYTLLWLSGVAQAAEQWDFTDTPTSGTGIVPGTLFLHGATLGLEASW